MYMYLKYTDVSGHTDCYNGVFSISFILFRDYSAEVPNENSTVVVYNHTKGM